MARSHILYLARSDAPGRKPLQEAIDALKFRLVLDHAYAPFETSGYLPCTLEGEDAGFDIHFSEAKPDLSSFPALRARIGPRDGAMTFRWGGDPRERASALIVSAALAQAFGALAHDPETDAVYEAPALIAMAREAAAAAL
ncbi:hypothetical protein [Methylocapsa palsarum]|uniref:Uncharacterized protein n=1 Tax=Methylocapsa palsarum TaxID=1612308 RepID=A0A1I4AID6_9HYPH|nr:hypothetical protein [Methylocapsa palsarum]SFK56242.1 hypothetical protein SAMN05444581_110128 [Methylocapsa palsarum]